MYVEEINDEFLDRLMPGSIGGKPIDRMIELGKICYDSLQSGRSRKDYHKNVVRHGSVYRLVPLWVRRDKWDWKPRPGPGLYWDDDIIQYNAQHVLDNPEEFPIPTDSVEFAFPGMKIKEVESCEIDPTSTTFYIECTRACMSQLTRYSWGFAPCVQSGRYTISSEVNYLGDPWDSSKIFPAEIANDEDKIIKFLRDVFNYSPHTCRKIARTEKRLIDTAHGERTRMVMTGWNRSWRHLCRQRMLLGKNEEPLAGHEINWIAAQIYNKISNLYGCPIPQKPCGYYHLGECEE